MEFFELLPSPANKIAPIAGGKISEGFAFRSPGGDIIIYRLLKLKIMLANILNLGLDELINRLNTVKS